MARRNANGEGSTYRRKDGRYEAAVYAMTTTGKRKRIRIYGRTRQEAHAKLIEAKQRSSQGIPTPDRTWRLGDYLDYWLEKIVLPGQRPSTYTRYESTVRLHLKPGLGHVALARLTVPQIQMFLHERLSAGKSLRTVQIMREVLRSALTNAMREELLVRNPAALTRLEKRKRRKIVPWTAADTKAFLDAIAQDPYHVAFLMMCIYGLRLGEVLGLRWSDVDLATARLHITHQLQRVRGNLTLVPPKTDAGIRDLVLVDLVATALMEHRPNGSADTDFIITGQYGGPMEPCSLRRAFYRLCQKHHAPPIRPHDLRHSQATLLKKLGVSARDAQLILGHSSVQTTQEIYQHEDMESQKEALQQVERLFLRTCSAGVAVKLSRQPTKPAFCNRGQLWLGMRDSNSTWDRVLGPVTGAVEVLKERTKLCLLGRVAVKNSRQIDFAETSINLVMAWSFAVAWLGRNEHGW